MKLDNCYLCGRSPAPHPISLKDSFTAHNRAKCPESDCLCDRCDYSINLRANFWNEKRGKYSLLYARNWSWLWQGDKLLSPVIGGDHDGYPLVTNLASRIEIRDWLLNPPEPPFTIAIAQSGQKHILFLAEESHSRDLFPVQLEVNQVWVNRDKLVSDLEAFESIMGLGVGKTQILTGEYASGSLLKCLPHPEFGQWESIVARLRGQLYLELIAHVAQAKEIEVIAPEPVSVVKPEPKGNYQMSLF